MMSQGIPFSRPVLVGNELSYIAEALQQGNLAGDGYFTNRCSEILQERLGISKVLITPSCTTALEMVALLCDFGPDAEVIMPSFTFPSTATAAVRAGARPVFVDIRPDTLNIDENLVERAITERTRAIFVVHYAGVACEMDSIMELAQKYDLKVIEDAAQGVNAHYHDKALGSIGDLAAFSFHETKNHIAGQGGALCINSPEFVRRAEIIRDKGTNRQQFMRGEVRGYNWVDVGLGGTPNEITAAMLCAQLEEMDAILDRRRRAWCYYRDQLAHLEVAGVINLPTIPKACGSNHHLFYTLLEDAATRDALIQHMGYHDIQVVFHYIPLHSSPMGRKLVGYEQSLPVTEDVSRRLLRLPLFDGITELQQEQVCEHLCEFLMPQTMSSQPRPSQSATS